MLQPIKFKVKPLILITVFNTRIYYEMAILKFQVCKIFEFWKEKSVADALRQLNFNVLILKAKLLSNFLTNVTLHRALSAILGDSDT